MVAGNYLADHWPGKKIAILHDNTTFGKGSAETTKKQLNHRGVTEAIYQAYVPGKHDYGAEIAALQAADIAVAVHWRIPPRDRSHGARRTRPRLPGSAGRWRHPGERGFGLIAGAAAEGALFIDHAGPARNAEAAPVVERFRASGFEPEGDTLYAYAAVQVWAQAARKPARSSSRR